MFRATSEMQRLSFADLMKELPELVRDLARGDVRIVVDDGTPVAALNPICRSAATPASGRDRPGGARCPAAIRAPFDKVSAEETARQLEGIRAENHAEDRAARSRCAVGVVMKQ